MADTRSDGEADVPFSVTFVERFADYWTMVGGSRIEGRIAGFLLLDQGGGVTAAELARALGISRGSISACTRRLVDAGFVQRIRRPGERADYFVMAADVWGGFLERQQSYLAAQRDLAAEALEQVRAGSPAHERLLNMRDYMAWLLDGLRLGGEWARFKERRDADR